MFFDQIAGHIRKFRQIQAKSKNGLKFDFGRLCYALYEIYVLGNKL